MNIQPKGAPALANSNSKAVEARAKAIAMIQGGGAPNPTAPSTPAEVLLAQAKESEEGGQPDTSVEVIASSTDPVEEPKAKEETPPAAPVEEDKPLSSQYAQLARKERALRAKAQELKAKEDAFHAQQAKLTQVKEEQSFKERLKADPFGALNEVGLSYDQLVNSQLNQPSPEQRAQQEYLSKLEAKIAALEESQNKTTKSFEEQQTQAYQQAVNQIRNETKQLVAKDPAFETIHETGSVDDVVDLIEKTFKADGVLLTVEEAATAVEEYLVEEAMRLTKLKKIQQRLAPKVQEPAKVAEPTKQTQPQMKTLTNAHGVSRQLTAKERAILAFKGEKKN